MGIAWKSATNCAQSYELALSRTPLTSATWPFGSVLRPEHVYDGFVIMSLLESHRLHNSILMVPHTGEQKHCFTQAMHARNALLRLYSQPEITHYCDKCIRVFKGHDRQGKSSDPYSVPARDLTIGSDLTPIGKLFQIWPDHLHIFFQAS